MLDILRKTALLALLTTATNAGAGFLDGPDLADWCNREDQAACTAYILGIADNLGYFNTQLGIPGRGSAPEHTDMCIPRSTNPRRLVHAWSLLSEDLAKPASRGSSCAGIR